MSCSWDVYCVQCDNRMGLTYANHREKMVHSLIQHRVPIAALLPVIEDFDDYELKICGNWISPGWFKKHEGHKLVARNEYGVITEERCDSCGHTVGTTYLYAAGERLGQYCGPCSKLAAEQLKLFLQQGKT